MSNTIMVEAAGLRHTITRYLETMGLPEEHAAWTAEYLVDVEQSGVQTHGLRRLFQYSRALADGAIARRPVLEVTSLKGSILKLDGGNGLGQVVGTWMINKAAAVAKETGVALVTVRNANHLGALGYYLRLPASRDLGGFLCQATSPNMLSVGASEPRLGNNPFALSLPTDREFPLALDIACSQVSRGRIRIAQRTGEAIPPNWALRSDGEPAQTAEEALTGALLPFAGHKGAGLATLLGGLAGVLSGASYGGQIPDPDEVGKVRNIGYFLILFDVNHLINMDSYNERMRVYLNYLTSAPLRPGASSIGVPGQASAKRREANSPNMTVAADLWADLIETFRKHHLTAPDQIAKRSPFLDNEDLF